MELTVFELVYYFDLFDWKENEMHFGLWLLLYLIPMFILFLLVSTCRQVELNSG